MTIDNWADPPLRGYSSMPAMQTLPEECQLDTFAAALGQVLAKAARHRTVGACIWSLTLQRFTRIAASITVFAFRVLVAHNVRMQQRLERPPQGKYAMPDGITPKSVFEWQLPSSTASPSTPLQDMLQTTPPLPTQGDSLSHHPKTLEKCHMQLPNCPNTVAMPQWLCRVGPAAP